MSIRKAYVRIKLTYCLKLRKSGVINMTNLPLVLMSSFMVLLVSNTSEHTLAILALIRFLASMSP
jgi:multidrug efflux pump subunit AcrB